MTSLLDLESAIIDRLKTEVPEANVMPLPLNPEEIGVAVSASQIWVAFRQETFDAPPRGGTSNPLKPVSLNRAVTFELLVRGQQLREKGHQRIYPILDKIRDALTGWMPCEIHTSRGLTRPFYPTQSGFVNMGAGLWLYSMTFVCNAVYTAPLRIE